MFLGKVMGSVWAVQQEEGMDTLKLLVVKPITFKNRGAGQTIIAADRIGAGVGERVIVSRGSPPRSLLNGITAPIDALVVGIVDSFEVDEEDES